MRYVDDKQRTIIESWFARANDQENDAYAQFMSIWIAFNAYCYACFASEANRPRPSLRQDKGISLASQNPATISGSIRKDESKVCIEIDQPGRIVIDLAEKYTEDIIFSRFAKVYQADYDKWRQEPELVAGILALQEALHKPGRGTFVINMARIGEYPYGEQPIDPEDIKRLVQRNAIVPLEDTNKLRSLIDVLYQIRCNIFHGEKVPGELNDDCVVKAALPSLQIIMSHLLAALVPRGH